jgi:uncharacterized protein YjbI with pentapeptide repeats
MPLFEIKSWFSARVLWSGEAETLKQAAETAVASGAHLGGADLRGAHLFGAHLGGANLGEAEIPVIPNLDQHILAALEAGGTLQMSAWHGCATTHCRAGWAITLAGAAGAALEKRLGPSTAGALIYQASAGYVPDFCASNEAALADIRAHATASGAETDGEPHA